MKPYPKMKASVKKLWLAALRSGKYAQGDGMLRDEKNFCCLGVLCDVARKPLRKGWRNDTFDKATYYLPNSVRAWAGFEVLNLKPDDDESEVEPVSAEKQLSKLNDEGKGFTEIADWIEKNL